MERDKRLMTVIREQEERIERLESEIHRLYEAQASIVRVVKDVANRY